MRRVQATLSPWTSKPHRPHFQMKFRRIFLMTIPMAISARRAMCTPSPVGFDVYRTSQWHIEGVTEGKENNKCLLAYFETDEEMEQHRY